jgi:hypothetical protein
MKKTAFEEFTLNYLIPVLLADRQTIYNLAAGLPYVLVLLQFKFVFE